jgi:hypothetical protein
MSRMQGREGAYASECFASNSAPVTFSKQQDLNDKKITASTEVGYL